MALQDDAKRTRLTTRLSLAQLFPHQGGGGGGECGGEGGQASPTPRGPLSRSFSASPMSLEESGWGEAEGCFGGPAACAVAGSALAQPAGFSPACAELGWAATAPFPAAAAPRRGPPASRASAGALSALGGLPLCGAPHDVASGSSLPEPTAWGRFTLALAAAPPAAAARGGGDGWALLPPAPRPAGCGGDDPRGPPTARLTQPPAPAGPAPAAAPRGGDASAPGWADAATRAAAAAGACEWAGAQPLPPHPAAPRAPAAALSVRLLARARRAAARPPAAGRGRGAGGAGGLWGRRLGGAAHGRVPN